MATGKEEHASGQLALQLLQCPSNWCSVQFTYLDIWGLKKIYDEISESAVAAAAPADDKKLATQRKILMKL